MTISKIEGREGVGRSKNKGECNLLSSLQFFPPFFFFQFWKKNCSTTVLFGIFFFEDIQIDIFNVCIFVCLRPTSTKRSTVDDGQSQWLFGGIGQCV